MSELYIYLGLANDTMFFIHHKFDSRWSEAISSQIMNCLIEFGFAKEKNYVVIYEMGETSTITTIQHEKGKFAEFDLENLAEYLPQLMKADRDDAFVIDYSYDTKAYNIRTINPEIFPVKVPEGKPKISGITHIMTTKEVKL